MIKKIDWRSLSHLSCPDLRRESPLMGLSRTNVLSQTELFGLCRLKEGRWHHFDRHTDAEKFMGLDYE
jgi:hypothetical protein